MCAWGWILFFVLAFFSYGRDNAWVTPLQTANAQELCVGQGELKWFRTSSSPWAYEKNLKIEAICGSNLVRVERVFTGKESE